MKVANQIKDYPTKLKTAKQWVKLGYEPKKGIVGTLYWTNCFCGKYSKYYRDDEVKPISNSKMESIKKQENKKRREQYKKRKLTKIMMEKWLEYNDFDIMPFDELKQWYECILEKENQIKKRNIAIQDSLEKKIETYENPSKMIVLDLETTGLDSKLDEILQISILDGNGNILINEYIKPYFHEQWHQAQEIHGITPDMVENCKHIDSFVSQLVGILNSCQMIIGYNVEFDLDFIRALGIEIDKEVFDVMMEFAPIYGEWSDYHRCYKWQKLSICASYYKYDWMKHGNAHNSLADCYATLYCYNKIIKVSDKI